MPYQSSELLFSHFRDNNIDLSNIEAQLQLVAPNSPNLPLYRDMMLTILRMAHDDSDRWSAKITLQALRELDQSFRTLQRYKGRRKVTVFGSARTPLEHPMYALARELVVPVVLLDSPGGSFWHDCLDFISRQLEENRYILPSDLKLVRLVHSADEAVEEINQFYSNYHSSRWLKSQFVIRMHHALSEAALYDIQEGFADLRLSGKYHQQADSSAEHEVGNYSHLTRLSFAFNGRDQGRLRELVDFINLPENWAKPQPMHTTQRARQALKVS